MKKHYTSINHSKKRENQTLIHPDPGKLTLDFLKQFARVYTVEKNEKGTTVGLFLN